MAGARPKAWVNSSSCSDFVRSCALPCSRIFASGLPVAAPAAGATLTLAPAGRRRPLLSMPFILLVRPTVRCGDFNATFHGSSSPVPDEEIIS